MNTLITGSNGQLGNSLKKYFKDNALFTGRDELDITDKIVVEKFFSDHEINLVINAAAYTNVDGAEDDNEGAYGVNFKAVSYLVNECNKRNIPLIHISTDYVFDGTKNSPYKETDEVGPLGVYAKSKRDAEEYIINKANSYIIMRTGWVFSEFGNNFVKTMLRLSETKNELGVVSDQWGSPTYAGDLAKVIKLMSEKELRGIYHFSNEGICNWAEFAVKIFKLANKNVKVNLITSKDYPTKAQRPKYSVLSKEKLKKDLNIEIPNWEESLSRCLKILDPKKSSDLRKSNSVS